jgi:hypothetical protein
MLYDTETLNWRYNYYEMFGGFYIEFPMKRFIEREFNDDEFAPYAFCEPC